MSRLDKLQEEFDIDIQGRPYLLRPGTPKEGKPREPRSGESPDHLSEPLKGYAEEAGLIMRPPTKTPYTMYALEATEYAKEQGRFEAFHRLMYRAVWEHGKDIGDLDVIREAAEEAGLNWPELEGKLKSRSYEAVVMDQYRQAMDIGIEGVPGFVIGNYMFTGAQPYHVFQDVMNKVLDESLNSTQEGEG
ncbi:MAG: DsbA family protein [Chloroflexi bacterium]|nr:DsbA family protein [Chloroflexota bacterium]